VWQNEKLGRQDLVAPKIHAKENRGQEQTRTKATAGKAQSKNSQILNNTSQSK
jgi:hypothetical protein